LNEPVAGWEKLQQILLVVVVDVYLKMFIRLHEEFLDWPS